MFTVKFKAVDDFDQLKRLSAKEFDESFRDIEGIIELNFNEYKYGYFFEDCPFGEERLVRWFKDLLAIAIKAQESNYVAYKIPEHPSIWLEFKVKEDEFLVSIVDDIQRDSILDLFINQPYKEFQYIDWSNVSISKEVFKKEIVNQGEKLIHFIEVLNPQILKSNSINELLVLMNKVASIT
ncbi:hypothetical protein [Brevibacillus borstelensis]|jgi:hypothetical protein|uniref:hypothetical protein n=1 Tax=Brevibacillus borstelensis TaxID=45462 RepID=UPI00046A0578|nr:hypothetical protein [Brevibacillus borstelensis]KKX55320.1 hypothetical protein X546_06385 [Brevibacillus borstelensis cifa_chp40]MED1881684.1 hypothetical protein [Brevibacillus borstelensis]RNB62626.1 hypothetical protein EDM54_13835 [Brevibacillus borstelensis]GED55829.1 hypothetical protein BBO01nite_50700 [Brevibacillus borstelensis]